MEIDVRSGIAWLSSSNAEISRAREVLDALRKPGVIDELGFLMLNGAFAERLYPGVTTIMTRARYLIFVPAIYQYLERSRKAKGKDVDRVSRDLQFDLRNALAKNEERYIGREGGRNLIRVPSEIYWSSLGALGIATRRVSESSYQRQLSGGIIGPRVYRDDDEAAHDEEADSLWSPDLKLAHVMPDGTFPESTDLSLRKAEAAFLESRYARLTPEGNESLVTRQVAVGKTNGAASLSTIEYPWQIPGVSASLEAVLDHARRLSLLARGVTLQYYQMIIEKRRINDPSMEDAFVAWWKEAESELAKWDLSAFFRLMMHWQAGRGPKDREFISSWLERIQAARTARAALSDKEARLVISRREDCVRPGKQRLRVKHQLESWKLPDGVSDSPYYMDYRHRVGRQIAIDIVEGLERGAS